MTNKALNSDQVTSVLQMLNSDKVANVIDEQYNPKNTAPQLHELVEDEMRLKGFDPLNKDDVRKFWRTKGIEV